MGPMIPKSQNMDQLVKVGLFEKVAQLCHPHASMWPARGHHSHPTKHGLGHVTDIDTIAKF